METPGLGSLAGSRVLEGQVSEDSYVRIAREREVLWSGRIRRLQGGDPALAGQECAIAFDGFEAFQAGDSIETFRLEPLA
jgi:translation initiation factor IF-2